MIRAYRVHPDGTLEDRTAQVEGELAAQPPQPRDSGQRFLAFDEDGGDVGVAYRRWLARRGVHVEPLILGDERRPRRCE